MQALSVSSSVSSPATPIWYRPRRTERRPAITRLLFLLLVSAFNALVAAVPSDASADVRITITDGISTVSPTFPKPGFELSRTSVAGSTTALALLKCTSRPCIIFFPSGRETAQTGDTFRFRDACKASSDTTTTGLPTCPSATTAIGATSPVARVVKTDSSTDRIDLKGLQITALAAGAFKTLTVIFETQQGDLATVSSSSGSYPFSVTLNGTYTRKPPQTSGGSGGLTASCPNPDLGLTDTQLRTPCAKLSLQVNGVTANGTGLTGTATASIPCRNGTVNPCAAIGGSYSSTGSVNTTDSSSISCGTSCSPVHKATLSATFTAADQTLALINSGIGAMSGLGEEAGGLEDLFHSLADELGANFWVAFTAGTELYRAVPQPPWINETRHFPNYSVVPIVFELQQAQFVRATAGVTLTSIVNDADKLTASEQARNQRSYAAFIAQPLRLQWKDVTWLTLTYQFITGNSFSGDPRIGNLLFSDCAGSAFRLEVALATKEGADVGSLIVNLGSQNKFSSGCAAAANGLSGTNLVGNPDSRVDPSFLLGTLAGKCCMTLTQSQRKYGNLFVRSASVVVDQGKLPAVPARSYKVNLLEGVVNAASSSNSLVVAGGYEEVTELPEDGRSIQITKLTGAPIPPVVIDNDAIDNIGGQFRTHVPVQTLSPDPGGTTYRVDLCLFGGRCVPMQGFLTLF